MTNCLFWPWSSGELRALITDAKLAIDEPSFSQGHYKFGKVLRHVLGEDSEAEGTLEAHLNQETIEILLSSTSLNINRDTTSSNR